MCLSLAKICSIRFNLTEYLDKEKRARRQRCESTGVRRCECRDCP
jgi:hypothetical protein